MSNNYFAIERKGKCVDHIYIKNRDDTIAFEDVMNMSYAEIVSYDNIEEFVYCIMDVTNLYFDDTDEQTIVTLIGEDDVFIWSIILGPDGEDLRYCFVDWKQDGKYYRYEKK